MGNQIISSTGKVFNVASGVVVDAEGVMRDLDGNDLMHTRINAKDNSWHMSEDACENVYSNEYIEYDTWNVHGANVNYVYKQIEVTEAGMYWISFSVSRYSTNSDTLDFSISVNDSEIPNTRAYISGDTGGSYNGNTQSIAYYLNAGDHIGIVGSGHTYGSTGDSMSTFSGIKVGE